MCGAPSQCPTAPACHSPHGPWCLCLTAGLLSCYPTNPAAVFYDKRPDEIGPQLQTAYVNAIKQLVPGGMVGGRTGQLRALPCQPARQPMPVREAAAEVTSGSSRPSRVLGPKHQRHASAPAGHWEQGWRPCPAAGARVDFKTHLDDGDWTGPNGEQGIGAAAAPCIGMQASLFCSCAVVSAAAVGWAASLGNTCGSKLPYMLAGLPRRPAPPCCPTHLSLPNANTLHRPQPRH